MKKIFISRELSPDSVFRQLDTSHYSIFHESLMSFESVLFDSLPIADWLFFYSANGVRFFVENCINKNIYFKNFKIATIGNATAEALLKYNLKATFVGNGSPKQCAQTFEQQLNDETIIFVQAENSQKSIEKFITKPTKIIPLIVYKNIPKKDIKIPFCDVLIFTSPMNAQVYFEHYSLQEKQTIIAIGQTTEKALKSFSIENITVAPEPSEKALFDLVLSK